MVNKKLLGKATSGLKLPAKKAKGEKKTKWQASDAQRTEQALEVSLR